MCFSIFLVTLYIWGCRCQNWGMRVAISPPPQSLLWTTQKVDLLFCSINVLCPSVVKSELHPLSDPFPATSLSHFYKSYWSNCSNKTSGSFQWDIWAILWIDMIRKKIIKCWVAQPNVGLLTFQFEIVSSQAKCFGACAEYLLPEGSNI